MKHLLIVNNNFESVLRKCHDAVSDIIENHPEEGDGGRNSDEVEMTDFHF